MSRLARRRAMQLWTRRKRRSATQLAVNVQELGNRGGIPTSEAALGRDIEILGITLGDGHAPARALDAVGVMDEAEHEACPRRQVEALQRSKVAIVLPVARDCHVHEIERPRAGTADAIGKRNADAEISWFDHMPVAGIAVTQMDAKLGGVIHMAAQSADPFERPGDRVAVGKPESALGGNHLETDIPLNAQPSCRNCMLDAIKFANHCRLD